MKLIFKGEVREPYMGNQVPLLINVYITEEFLVESAEVVGPDGIRTLLQPLNNFPWKHDEKRDS